MGKRPDPNRREVEFTDQANSVMVRETAFPFRTISQRFAHTGLLIRPIDLSTMPVTFTIRRGAIEDTPLILEFIRDLAAYEKLSHEVTVTEDDLRRNLFGKNSVAEALLVFESKDPAGFALFFHNFSTFLGKPGIYLEDLFVRPLYRKKGYGKALLTHLAALAIERGCGRFEWSVLDWNQPSIDFYRSLGARPMEDWTIFRLDGDALRALVSVPCKVR